MELMLEALVTLVQLALGGFVMWGGWLCFSDWLRTQRARPAPVVVLAEARPEGFERVASLVLLALLCTAIVGLA